jgi:hypothetical protein
LRPRRELSTPGWLTTQGKADAEATKREAMAMFFIMMIVVFEDGLGRGMSHLAILMLFI